MFPGSEARARVRLHGVRPLRHAPRPAPGKEPPPAAAPAAEASVAAADAGGKRGAEVAAGLLQREYILPCGLLHRKYILPCGLLQREQQRDHGDQLQHRAGESPILTLIIIITITFQEFILPKHPIKYSFSEQTR